MILTFQFRFLDTQSGRGCEADVQMYRRDVKSSPKDVNGTPEFFVKFFVSAPSQHLSNKLGRYLSNTYLQELRTSFSRILKCLTKYLVFNPIILYGFVLFSSTTYVVFTNRSTWHDSHQVRWIHTIFPHSAIRLSKYLRATIKLLRNRVRS